MENTEGHLPEDDIDAKLAREIGDALDRGKLDTLLERSDNRFVSALGAFSALHEIKQAATGETAEVWSRIKAVTAKDSQPGRRRLRLVAHGITSYPWAAAASLMLFAIVAIFALTLLQSDTDRLIAQAETSSQSIELSDGSTIVLRRHSKLYRVSDRGHKVVYRLEGEATFAVTHDPSRSFVVEAGVGEVSVLGTTFVISTWGDETRVFLSEGSVRFANRIDSDEVLLKPGQESTIKSDHTISEPVAADENEFLDWISDQMVFDHRTVKSVIAEFGHHFGVVLSVPDLLSSETITGTIELNSLEQSLNTLGIVLGGEFVLVESAQYAFRESQ